jgi:hypothetical protein
VDTVQFGYPFKVAPTQPETNQYDKVSEEKSKLARHELGQAA